MAAAPFPVWGPGLQSGGDTFSLPWREAVASELLPHLCSAMEGPGSLPHLRSAMEGPGSLSEIKPLL